jgi:hypothetical protein
MNTTSLGLIDRLKQAQPDASDRHRLQDIYLPLIRHWLACVPELGDKIDDLTQEVLFLADELQERSRRFGTILSRGLAPKAAAGPLLAGTGSDPEREQSFIRGLMDRLAEGQSCVYWTPETLAEEANYAFWATFGWTILGIGIASVLAFSAIASSR